MGASKSLIQKFLSTSGERLTEFGELLSTLNRVQERDDVVRRLARDLHTYKGESRLLGLEEIERLAHRAEELLQVLIAAAIRT
ncbi:MAG: Hpt domain-containing protein, partial [Myxococcota bacterium]